MTIRLYYPDSWLAEFTATVQAVEGNKVYLDRTAFYPTSGGQPFDTGEIAGLKVVDVVDEDHRIAHVLAVPASLAAGVEVKGRLDWARRFDHMQQHTGQHLLSAVFAELFGHKTVSVHFGAESSTLDIDTENLPHERLVRAERRANELVYENRPVTVAFEDAAAAEGLRKATDRAGEIRIVSIGALDRSACGGTHVRSTGEIGTVLIRKAEKYKKLTRVEFLCGARAVARSRADHEALTEMAATMTAAVAELPALVASQAANLRAVDSERRKLADDLALYRARERWEAAVPGADGVRRIVKRLATVNEARAMGQGMAALPKTLFAGVVSTPPGIVFAASEDSGLSAGAALKGALGTVGGRGGGNPRIAQGTVADAAALEDVVRALMPGQEAQ